MSVSPIDLQALYAQTLNVGQEQSVMKESLVASQSAQGSAIARRTQENDKSVQNSQNVGDGPENTDGCDLIIPPGGDCETQVLSIQNNHISNSFLLHQN